MGRADRQQHRNQVESGLRVVSGEQPGLGARWKHGVATVDHGSLSFSKFLGGVRLLRQGTVSVEVGRVSRSERETTGVGTAFSVMPGMTVVQLETPTAVLEWVLPPAQVDWACDRVRAAR